jgi:hypothetical protein
MRAKDLANDTQHLERLARVSDVSPLQSTSACNHNRLEVMTMMILLWVPPFG